MTGQQERTETQGGHPYDPCEPDGEEVVGLVIAGAAARGPYEAGALAELIPALSAEHQRPVVLLGTSSGALNAALLAQFAHEGEAAGENVAETWLSITSATVFVNAYCTLLPDALRLGAGFLRGAPVGGRITGLLDSDPLRRLAEEQFHPGQVAANVRAGLVRSVGVAATFCPPDGVASRTRIFLQGQQPSRLAQGHAVDIVPTDLAAQHLLASAAIPMIFPPVEITEPESAAGSYIDGGVRLNAPLLPAVGLDVTRLVVVSSHSMRYAPAPPVVGRSPAPDLEASSALTLRAVLADGLVDDLSRLGRHNELACRLAAQLPRDQLPYRCIPYRFVAPEDGVLARLAGECFRGRRRLPTSSYWLIGRLLGAAGAGIGLDELLSFVLFDPEYAERQVELGRRHARAALQQPWRLAPLT